MAVNTKSGKVSSAVDYSQSEEVYLIRAKCAQVLETTDSRQKAIKMFLTEYKGIVAGAYLQVRRGGKLYSCNPTGTAADYAA